MDIALELFLVDAIQHLLVAHRAECGHREYLCLPAGKHPGTMYTRQQIDFCCKRAHLVHLAAIHALLFVQQPAAYNIFLCAIHTFLDLCLLLRVDRVKFLVYFFIDGLQALIADILVIRIKGVLYILHRKILDGGEHLFIRLIARIAELLLADLLLDALDKLDDLLVGLMARHNAVIHLFVGDNLRPRLDHCDALIRRGNRDCHPALFTLLCRRVDDIFAVDHSDRYARNRAVPRNIGDGQRDGGTHHGSDFRLAIVVYAHHRADNRYIVAHILGEQRTDGAVNHTGGQNCLIARAAFPL